MEIVQFKDGRYAVRKGNRFTGYKYSSHDGTFWFWLEDHVESCCKFIHLKNVQALYKKLTAVPPPRDYGRSLTEIYER